MKKIKLLIILTFMIFTTKTAFANMAAPLESDIGSTITFEENDKISVVSEVLDIRVTGSQAEIVASYEMKNITNEKVSTKSMFLSPNVENNNVSVVANEKELSFDVESYHVNSVKGIETKDWEYVVLSSGQALGNGDVNTVDTISFELAFEEEEEYEVVVSYTYNLGGYPDYDFDVKKGIIEYYLLPASMWKDFSDLTINLYLDKDMPVIKESNLDFKKTGSRTYTYTSDTLPEENLKIVIDENWWQNIFSTLRSPYLLMVLMIVSPFILVILCVIGFVVWRKRKNKLKNIK